MPAFSAVVVIANQLRCSLRSSSEACELVAAVERKLFDGLFADLRKCPEMHGSLSTFAGRGQCAESLSGVTELNAKTSLELSAEKMKAAQKIGASFPNAGGDVVREIKQRSVPSAASCERKYKFGDFLLKPAMRALTNNPDYEIGDLTRGAIASLQQASLGSARALTNNPDYEIGDLTRGAIASLQQVSPGSAFRDLSQRETERAGSLRLGPYDLVHDDLSALQAQLNERLSLPRHGIVHEVPFMLTPEAAPVLTCECCRLFQS
jgi:hypothetical protein